MKFTSQDLAKAMGLKVGDKIKTLGWQWEVGEDEDDGTIRLFDPHGGDIHIGNLLDREYTIIPLKPILTEDEKVILRNLAKEYVWITRDYDGRDLCLHINKPVKHSTYWYSKEGHQYLIAFNHKFSFINWEDEPYEIAELLK